jgi:hypothetical protein
MKREYNNKRHPFLRGLKFLGFIILGALAAAGFAFVFGYFVMLLWNWLMPEIFGLIAITFWQAAGIVLLARLVFGGFKHGHDHSKKNPHSKSSFLDHWKGKSCNDHSMKNWRHFDDYWWDEGEQSYKDYVERKKEQEQK